MSGTSVNVIPAVKVNRTLSVPREKIFQAWMNNDEIKNWFLPAEGYSVIFAEVNPRKNTRFRISLKDTDGNQHIFGGVLQQTVFPEKLDFTWASNGGGTQQQKSFVTIDFIEKGTQTEVKLIHKNFPNEEMREGYSKSWNYILDQLDKYLK
jgi:uncharacterized protein YndB with AHSA1/START domain